MAKDLAELGLNFNDLEIVPEPRFDTPYEFLKHYAPEQDWSAGQTFTWEDVRNHPELAHILTRAMMCQSHPMILLRKKA